MAQPYLTELQQLAGEWTRADERLMPLECRHFFSGAAAYRDGVIVATLTPVGLAFKVTTAVRDRLLSDGKAVALRYFPQAPTKRDYVLFPDAAVDPTEAARLILDDHLPA